MCCVIIHNIMLPGMSTYTVHVYRDNFDDVRTVNLVLIPGYWYSTGCRYIREEFG